MIREISFLVFSTPLPGVLVSRVIVCLPVGQATVGGAGGGAVVLCLVGGGGGRVGAGRGQGRTEARLGRDCSFIEGLFLLLLTDREENSLSMSERAERAPSRESDNVERAPRPESDRAERDPRPEVKPAWWGRDDAFLKLSCDD